MKAKFFTLIELIVAIVIIVIGIIMLFVIIALIFVGCGAYKKAQEVNEVGAKKVLEEVWEGPDRPAEETNE